MSDTMQNPESGEANAAEVAAMTAAGLAPDRYLMGTPQWFNDYSPLDIFRAGYALARQEATAQTGDQAIAQAASTGREEDVPSPDALLEAIDYVIAPYYLQSGLGQVTDRDALQLASGMHAYLIQQARQTGEQA